MKEQIDALYIIDMRQVGDLLNKLESVTDVLKARTVLNVVLNIPAQ